MSQTKELELTCPQCNVEFSRPGHMVVDMADEADSEALWQLQNGSLNRVECPNCGAPGMIPIPVILNIPEQELLLLFVPGLEQMEQAQLNWTIQSAMQEFIEQLPEERQAEYLLQPIITDEITTLQQAARGELTAEDLMMEGEEDGEYDDDDSEDEEEGGELTEEEQQEMLERMNLLQQLFQASDSLERISFMRNSQPLVDDLFLEMIAIMSQQAETTQPEIIPILQKIMNEAEVFIASNPN